MNINCFKSQLCCVYCGKEYKLRSYLNKHVNLCEDIARIRQGKNISCSTTEQMDKCENVFTSETELYTLVSNFSKKQKELEERVKQLERLLNRANDKINIIEVLAKNKQDSNYFENALDHMSLKLCCRIFYKTFPEVVNEVLDIFLSNQMQFENTCFMAFLEKKNHIYVHLIDNGWSILKNEELLKILVKIHNGCINEITQKGALLNSDAEIRINSKLLLQLMKVNYNNVTLHNSTKKHIYKSIKQDINALITQYD